VTAHGLQFEHDAGESTGIDILARCLTLADVIILAKAATEVAASEKDGAGTALADQRRFLAEVRAIAGYPGQKSNAAATGLTGQPVDLAAAGAQSAAGQHLPGTVGALTEQATGIEGMGGDGHGKSLDWPVILFL
jgi:hypothetical protein